MYCLRLGIAALLLGMMVPGSGVAAMAAGRQATAAPGAGADWKADIERRRQALIAKNGPGTDAAERAELLKMRGEDQRARGVDTQAKGAVQIATNLAEIDKALTEELKMMVRAKGWPTIAQVGIDASDAAMLILTHTRDHAWQVSLIPMLVNLADEKKIDPSALALVIDKELVYEGKLQRYGTQFTQAADGTIAMYGVEDPGGLDRKREEVLLPPSNVYRQMLADMYHLKVSNKIVMAVAQGK